MKSACISVFFIVYWMQYSYSEETFTGRAKLIWIFGGPDNQRPDKRSSTVYAALTLQVVSDLRALFAVSNSCHASNVTRRPSSVGPTRPLQFSLLL